MIDRQRIIDVLVAAPALAVSSLPLLFAAAAAKITNRHETAFFKQKRYGLHGKPFTIYKIRTMTSQRGADGLLLPDAARVTRVGAFLRRTALDELPQFWNILKGDMSLIGPRPITDSGSKLSGFEARYTVRPGLTGLAHVVLKARRKKGSAQNASTVLREMLELDLRYVQTRTTRGDLRILWRTAAIVMTGRNDLMRVSAPMEPKSSFAPVRHRPKFLPEHKVSRETGAQV